MTIECYADHKSVTREHLKAELNKKPETLEGKLSDKSTDCYSRGPGFYS